MINYENLDLLIARLQVMPDENFDMTFWPYLSKVGDDPSPDDQKLRESHLAHKCGTSACIGGWCELTFDRYAGELSDEFISRVLGIDKDDAFELCFGDGVDYEADRSEALIVLRHLRETGEVNWSVVPAIAEAVARDLENTE